MNQRPITTVGMMDKNAYQPVKVMTMDGREIGINVETSSYCSDEKGSVTAALEKEEGFRQQMTSLLKDTEEQNAYTVLLQSVENAAL